MKKGNVYSKSIVMLGLCAGFSAHAEFDSRQSESEIMSSLRAQGITLSNTAEGENSSSVSSVEVDVYKHDANAGLNKEFVVVVVNGQIQNAYVSSTADSQHVTPEFQNIALDIPRGQHNIPYPWTVSQKYFDSHMYWGLHIHGGFFIHSTPYYDALGKAASHGCVRITFPAAMELWDLVVNQETGHAARINVFGSTYGAKGRALLAKNLAASGMTLSDLQAKVDSDYKDARAITHGEYTGRGHKRRDQDTVTWPSCGGYNCFTTFGLKQPN